MELNKAIAKAKEVRASLIGLNLCVQHDFQPEIDRLDEVLTACSALVAKVEKIMSNDHSKSEFNAQAEKLKKIREYVSDLKVKHKIKDMDIWVSADNILKILDSKEGE
jgi:hypothetical protein